MSATNPADDEANMNATKTFTDAEILTTIKSMTRPVKRLEGMTVEAHMPHIQSEFGTKQVRVDESMTGGRMGRRSTLRTLPNVTEARVIKIAEANGYKASPGGVWLALVTP